MEAVEVVVLAELDEHGAQVPVDYDRVIRAGSGSVACPKRVTA